MSNSTYNPFAYAVDPIWAEWVAAMYESDQADRDWADAPVGATLPEYAESLKAMSDYAITAQRLADRIEDATEEYQLTDEFEYRGE